LTEITEKRPGARCIISLVAAVAVALIFLFAGIGKLTDLGQMPGQTEYLDKMIPDFLLTPELARFIGLVFIPWILPVSEILLGLLLLSGLWPRIWAIAVMLLTASFMYNNIWMISQGIDKYPDCACFGFWETIFGPVSPAISLGIDIVMFALMAVVILVLPGGLLSSQFWIHKAAK
jgi:uncharacterized membrane protein YphA (DoxX/SURF4 family)